MIREAIVKIVNKGDLTYEEAYAVMNEIMSGETTPTQNAAFLAALSTKSARAETTDEIAGCAAAMRAHAVKVETGMELFEIVGTGGDNAQSFNISTTAALVAAAGGMKVAKHGNRAASSQCGTADCLEALGVNIHQSPAKCVELLREAGMCFFFAQDYHTSMKYVGAIRKELGFRTVFNILGPLTNPGTPVRQLLGVYDEYLVEPLAQVLINLGVKRGMVVYGQDKLDEISLSAPTTICEMRDGWFKTEVKPMGQFEAAYQSYHSMMNFFGLNQLLCGKHGLVMPIVDTDERRQDRGAFCAKYAAGRPYFMIRAKSPQLVFDEIDKLMEQLHLN